MRGAERATEGVKDVVLLGRRAALVEDTPQRLVVLVGWNARAADENAARFRDNGAAEFVNVVLINRDESPRLAEMANRLFGVARERRQMTIAYLMLD